MTVSQRLKAAVIDVLDEYKPDESIAIVDAKSRSEIEFPTLAVDVVSASSHSAALAMVEKVSMVMTLRVHSGDSEESSIDCWSDTIESAMHDESAMRDLLAQGLIVHQWLYQGSDQDWGEEVVEVNFRADALVSREV
jgi:hypothetical protein